VTGITGQVLELAAWEHEMRGPHGEWVTAFGDPTTARHVAVIVPGVGTAQDAAGEVQKARNLHEAMEGRDPGQTAAILWRGYVAPTTVARAVRKEDAIQAAKPLADFVHQIQGENPSAHYTVIGHSYGSVVAGEAAARHGMHPDDLVFAGSPGVSVRHASELGIPPEHVHAGLHSQDPIRDAADVLSVDFGGNPVHPRFGGQVFPAETPGVSFAGQGGMAHRSYFEPVSEALGNIARIAAQQPVAATVQFAGVTSQALELGWKDAYLHELRGPHGEWVRGPGTPSEEKWPGANQHWISRYWKNEVDPAAKQNLNLAGASYDADDYLGAAEYLRRASVSAADLADPSRYTKLADNIESDAMKRDPIGSLSKRLDSLRYTGQALPDALSNDLVHAQRNLEAAQQSTDEGAIAGQLSAAARTIGAAADKADDGSDLNAELEHLEHLTIQVSPGTAKTSGGGLRTQMQNFTSSFAPKVPGWLGGGKESWDGQVSIKSTIDGNPAVLAQLDWNRQMTIQEDVAKHIQTDLDMKTEPINDASSFSVPLHEMIHGVVEKGNNVRSDQDAYQDQANATIEEGFTELGTVHHMPEYLKTIGVADRQTDILSDMGSGPIPNPDWEHARQALHARLRDEAAQLRSDTGLHSQAMWGQAADDVDKAADYIDNGQVSDALGALSRAQHLGDSSVTSNILKIRKEINDFADIPEDKHSTMAEYATRLQDPVRVAKGDAWGHYPEQTRAAQEWVQQVAMNEAGDKPFDASTPGSKDWKRVVELSDEINRMGTAAKIQTMAEQIVRSLGITDMAAEDWDSVRENIREGFIDITRPSGKDAFRKALSALSHRGQAFSSISGQALELTGDGHGHHIPGTPYVYRHGFIPISGQAAQAGGLLHKLGSFMSDQGGYHPAGPELHQFAGDAASKISGLLGGGHETFNGQVQVWPKLEQPSSLAEMSWDGTMKMRSDVADQLSSDLAGTGKIEHPDHFHTVLHELLHTNVADGRTYADGENSYQDLAHAWIEEGFTELGATQHAAQFFRDMGIGDRPAGDGKSMAELAEQRAADPIPGSWGHYTEQEDIAHSWLSEIAAQEGVPEPERQDRINVLADEVNRVGVEDKIDVMVAQIVSAMTGGTISQQPASVAESIRKEILGNFGTESGEETVRNAAHAAQAAMAAERAA
jgi:pimeloyl-ACP methyl ester carboxylesterase